MPKKRTDPIVGVLSYFRDAPLEVAEMALSLAQDAVRQRKPKTGAVAKAPKAKKAKEVDVPLPLAGSDK